MISLRQIIKEVVKEELPFENMDSAEKKAVEKIYEADSAVRWRYGNTVQGKRKS